MQHIVVIAVEKVQRYIFQTIDETKKDKKTLSSVIKASNRVAEAILEEIEKEFVLSRDNTNRILWISGKVIFKDSRQETEIQETLERLFKKVYKKYKGNIFLKYAIFLENIDDKLTIINDANNLLKAPKIKGRILQANSEILFEFCENNEIEDNSNREFSTDVFLDNMDNLVGLDKKNESDSTDGKIAIVKADINNLGKIMSGMTNYEDYSKMSKLLEEAISLESFGNQVREYFQKPEKDGTPKNLFLMRKILPFYIAGDDIFYAVRIDSVLDSIKLLHKMIKAINGRIKEVVKGNKELLSIAVGVVFVNNHQPIRYYRQMVEKELSVAKKRMKTEKAVNSVVGISLAGNFFNIYDGFLGRGESDGFIRFYQEMRELKELMQKNVFTNTALHNLLVNLEIEKKEEDQLYNALYFLKPRLKKGEKNNAELYFKHYWLSQLIEEKKEDESREERGFSPARIRNQFIPKLKLVLLLLDDRYYGLAEENVQYKYIVSQNQKTRLRSVMFHKPLNYLLSSDKERGIVELFFEKTLAGKKVLYKSAHFNLSIFYRAKSLIQSGKAEKVVDLFKNYNESFNELKKGQKQNVHTISFSVDNFKQAFDATSNETKWVDKLILLYHYNEQRIILKTTEKLNKPNK